MFHQLSTFNSWLTIGVECQKVCKLTSQFSVRVKNIAFDERYASIGVLCDIDL